MPRQLLPLALMLFGVLCAPAASEPRDEAAPPAPAPDVVCDLASAADVGLAGNAKPTREDRAERAALVGFYGARQCAPVWVAGGRLTPQGAAVAAEIADGDAWGLAASAFRLPAVKDGEFSRGEAAEAEMLISLAVLKYARYARGGRAQPQALGRNLDRTLKLRDPAQLIGEIAMAADPASYLRQLHPQHPEFEVLRRKLLEQYLEKARVAPSPSSAPEANARGRGAPSGVPTLSATKLLVNMEQWRWMPDSLGDFYVVVNIPEFMLRVVKNGKVIHAQRVIVGKADKQTPIFSAELEKIIFHPSWGVPDSIKNADILPSLLRGSTRILERYNLRVQRSGRDIDPAAVDWSTTDMRSVHIYQPPGVGNVLGSVKFRFPNRHDVYMHDTPDTYLFKASQRAFSHGCMRLSEPEGLAELLLGEDQAWPAARVAAAIRSGPQDNQISIVRPISVHITYFTIAVDATGALIAFSDVYGHESRIAMGIAGKAHLIPKAPDSEPTRAEIIGRLSESSRPLKAGWAARAFGNN